LFTLAWNAKRYETIALNLHGTHNVLNGAAVFGLSLSLGIPEEAIRTAFSTFGGVKRRLEWKGEVKKIQLYDDYGHHPNEIRATLKALRRKVGERRIIACFQPHRFSRVRDLWEAFASAFEDADLVIMTEIYSAGESPIEGISSERFYAFLKEH